MILEKGSLHDLYFHLSKIKALCVLAWEPWGVNLINLWTRVLSEAYCSVSTLGVFVFSFLCPPPGPICCFVPAGRSVQQVSQVTNLQYRSGTRLLGPRVNYTWNYTSCTLPFYKHPSVFRLTLLVISYFHYQWICRLSFQLNILSEKYQKIQWRLQMAFFVPPVV